VTRSSRKRVAAPNPGLNLVVAEAGVGWIPFFAQEFDYYQMSFGPSPIGLGRQRDIPRPPSEYI